MVESLIFNSMVGSGFGFALQKARVFDPAVIQGQLLLQDFTMMQTFLAALGTSQLVAGFVQFTPLASKFQTCHNTYEKKSQGQISAVLGSTILGIGMSLAGACPGTIYAQLGSGVVGTPIVISGAVAGVLFYSMIEKSVQKHLNPIKRNNAKWVPDKYYPLVAIMAGSLLMTASWAFKTYLPNSVSPLEVAQQGMSSSFLSLGVATAVSWSKQLAGMMIGMMQVPSVTLLGHPMGMSSALVSVVSPLMYPLKWAGLIPKDGESIRSIKGFFSKLFFIGGVVGGAVLSAQLSSSYGTSDGLLSSQVFNKTVSLPIVYESVFGSASTQAFLGGFLLWLGARIGGGCTSGHGISGCTFLNFNSILAVPAMFAGGIITSFILKGLSSPF